MRFVSELDGLADQSLGYSRWRRLTDQQVRRFADSTEDHTAIHFDAATATAVGLPGPIAHGLLLLSLGPAYMGDLLRLDPDWVGLKYGYDRVRFLAPARIGDSVRMAMRVDAVEGRGDGIRVVFDQQFEGREAGLVCAATAIVYYRPPRAGKEDGDAN